MTPILTLAALAARYGCSLRTIQFLVQVGQLPRPSFRIGRKKFWREPDLEAWESQAPAPADEAGVLLSWRKP